MFYLCRMIKNGTPDYLCMKFCARVSLPVYLFKIQLWNTCCEIAGDTLNPVEKFKSQGLKNPTELKIGDLKAAFVYPCMAISAMLDSKDRAFVLIQILYIFVSVL